MSDSSGSALTATLLVLALLIASCAGSTDSAGLIVAEPVLLSRLVAFPEGLPDKLEPTTIHAVGDVIAHESVVGADGALQLSGTSDLLVGDGLTIANLECPASTAGTEQATVSFTCDPKLLADLSSGGIDVVSLANDRSVRRGRTALVETLENVEQAGLAVVGAGRNADEAYTPTFVEFDGWRVAVLGFTAIGSLFARADLPGTAAVERTKRVADAIAAAKADSDLVVVTVHWGRPLDRDPEERDRDYADALVEAGADIIFGHGPHRLQSFALVGDRPVFWSLGHFVWPQAEPADSDSAIARIEIAIDGTITTCLLPVSIDATGAPTLDRPGTSCSQ
jgi:poly-gamma-glutamate synthesis protein (capsule biosynthesis protein)